MGRLFKNKWSLRLGIVAISIAGLLSVLAVISSRSRSTLAHRWQRELTTLPDGLVEQQLRKIAAVEDEGIAVLVGALSSQRESVAQTAQEILAEQLERWRPLALKQSTAKIEMLAHHLAQQTKMLSPSGKSFAADMATQILLWPVGAKSGDSSHLIADCETILRASTVDDQQNSIAGQRRASYQDFYSQQYDPDTDQELVAAVSYLDPTSDLPGGALPVEVVQLPSLPPAFIDATSDNSPQQLSKPLKASPLNKSTVDGTFRRTDDFLLDESPFDSPIRLPDPFPKKSAPTDSPERKKLLDLDSLEAVRRLRSDDEADKEDAERELRRQGFRAVHFVLAEHLTDPDPDKRRELARMLPRVSNINPRRWLLWLSLDDDPQVRLEAISIMATSRDPELLDYIRQLPQQETDEEVLRQVQRLLDFQKR